MEKERVSKSKLMLGFLVFYASLTCTRSADTLSANQILRYNQTIVSPQETFELGFFSPRNSTNHYVGIWYKKISTGTVVWVANRNSPLTDTTGELTLTPQGVLILRNVTGGIVWLTPTASTRNNPIGRLLDTGNFIIHEEGDDFINQNNPIWQSFDFGTDTFLPGMMLGRDLVTGIETNFSSWKSDDDPAAGNFSLSLDTSGYPQPILRYNGEIMSRAGPWNGLRFSGAPHLSPNPIYRFKFVINQTREIYYQYDLVNTSVFTRMVVQPTGKVDRLLWIDSRQEWNVYLTPEIDICDRYAFCGPFGRCNINSSPVCDCLKGFQPTSLEQWVVSDWTQGCQHTTRLDCGPGEGFRKYSNLKLPDTRSSRFNQIMTLVECENTCKSNCSCTAYTYLNKSAIGTGTGCLLWFGDLIDIRTLSTNGDNLYIRLPPSELENSNSSNAGRLVRVIVPVAAVTLVILVSVCLFYRFKRNNKQEGAPGNVFGHDAENESGDEDLELPLFGLSTLHRATNNFSTKNKLGEGGFGPVYKVVTMLVLISLIRSLLSLMVMLRDLQLLFLQVPKALVLCFLVLPTLTLLHQLVFSLGIVFSHLQHPASHRVPLFMICRQQHSHPATTHTHVDLGSRISLQQMSLGILVSMGLLNNINNRRIWLPCLLQCLFNHLHLIQTTTWILDPPHT